LKGKPLLLFLVKFLSAITVILFFWVPVWLPIPSISERYISFVTYTAVDVAEPLVGLPDVDITTGGGFPGIIPFIALILATPNVKWIKRIKSIVAGSILLLFFHLSIIVLQIAFPSYQIGFFSFYAIFGRIALPLILWIWMSWDVFKPVIVIEGLAEERKR